MAIKIFSFIIACIVVCPFLYWVTGSEEITIGAVVMGAGLSFLCDKL